MDAPLLEFHEVLGDVLCRHNMTQSQLRERMPDKESMVPKWLSGERVPHPDDLTLIFAGLEPMEVERRELERSRTYSAMEEALRDPKLALSPEAVKQQLRTLVVRDQEPATLLVPIQLEEELLVIRQMRLEGRPMQALGAMEILKRQVEKDHETLHSRAGYPILAAYLKERLSLAVNTGLPGSVFPSLRADAEHLIELGRTHHDADLVAHGLFRVGDGHHLDKNPLTAVPLCQRAIELSSDIEIKARALSIMLISLAKRGWVEDKRKYYQAAHLAEQILGEAQAQSSIGYLWLLNEWGHSLAWLGETQESRAALDQAWETFEGLEREGLQYKNLRLALRRATLIAASRGVYDYDSEEILQMSRELREEALEGHYPRIVADAESIEALIRGKE